MSELGMLFHGFSEEDVKRIIDNYTRIFRNEIWIFSASGHKDRTVIKVLEHEGKQTFGDQDAKVIMLLGFDDEQVRIVLQKFPKGIQRPIFCQLTQDNIYWTVEYLIEHLLEEQRYWAEQAKKKKGETG